jgi:hypothetical protein
VGSWFLVVSSAPSGVILRCKDPFRESADGHVGQQVEALKDHREDHEAGELEQMGE